MKPYTLILLLVPLAEDFFGFGKISNPRTSGIPGVMEAEDKRALRDFLRRLESEEESVRGPLKVGNSTVILDEEGSRVLRRDAKGKLEWVSPLGGSKDRLRWPDLRIVGHRIIVREQFQGIWTLDSETGKVVWSAAGLNDCYLLSGDLMLLAYERQVVALAADTGKELFRLSLPTFRGFNTNHLKDTAGLFMAQTHESTFLFDRVGRIRHRFPGQVVAVVPAGQDRVFLTSEDIRRVTPENQTVWSVPFAIPMWWVGGNILKATNGDLVAFWYCPIANSGVQLIRVDPAEGKKRWETKCNRLSNVAHSAYVHAAEVEWCKGHLRVISHGCRGDFVEWLDGQTGKRIRRSEERR